MIPLFNDPVKLLPIFCLTSIFFSDQKNVTILSKCRFWWILKCIGRVFLRCSRPHLDLFLMRYSSTYRYTDYCAHWLIRLQSGAVEMQHNNRKLWVIGSILRSDPQLFDWFSFNWLSSPTWHHQSFTLEVRQTKWFYNTISMIRDAALETF